MSTASAPTAAHRLSGVVPPVITPRDSGGDVDGTALTGLVHRLIDADVDGLFILGSSGEVPYLTDAERRLVVETVLDAVQGRIPVLAGANDQTTARTIDEATRLASAGVDGLVASTPFYALADQSEVKDHFRRIRTAVDLPLYAYDVPVRTHLKLANASTVTLAEEGVLAGVKDSSGDDVAFRLLLLATSHLPDFRAFTGHEVVVDGALLSGAHGVVPGLANVDPHGYVRMFRAAQREDWVAARAEQDRLAELFRIVEVAPSAGVSPGAAGLGAFKTALQLMDVIATNTMSSPMTALPETERNRIRGVLSTAGLL